MPAPRIAVVGTGWWSANHHVPSLAAAPDVELVALCDPDVERAREVAAQHGGVPVVADLDALLELRPDGVVIATPHTTHHDLAAAALDAGVGVLLEKPMATTAADAFDLLARARRSGAVLSIGYTDQFVEVAARVRRAVQEDIGGLVQVTGEFTSATLSLFAAADAGDEGGDAADTHPQTYGADAGGGQAHTQLTHLLGMICWVTDREIRDVAAFTDHRGRGVDVDDAAALRFAGGGTGVVTSSGMAGTADRERRWVRYVGTHGVVEQDLTAGSATVRLADGARVDLRTPADEDPPRTWLPARRLAALVAGADVLDPAPGWVGAAAAAAVEAVLRSADERAVVAVPQLPAR
ncbi:Gfo/Idh/MocA family protein [Cellulomonas marina]|uniref:Predicted dehydrogenase n=1 Tax=Cellulomonas marina TaxID=988821 RepID=A0A1I0V2C1_9CELL|nr:Gfo/Idh/MocA family oxidoreductase [Cellulomonas marina]GIG28282.1 hypothetical protein Cma02nite_08820 [Cellulomonas marina]SFA70468.1 Predicted dehydrogenase [Cellulomonas marina]